MFLPRDTPASMWAGFIESQLETDANTEYIEIECGEGQESNEIFLPGEIILDNKQLYRLKVPKKQIFELSPFIKNMCSTNFREGSLQQVKTKFCPRVMSMFVAFVRGISFQAEWIDILALIDVCSFYECDLVVTMSYLKRNFVAELERDFIRVLDFYFIFQRRLEFNDLLIRKLWITATQVLNKSLDKKENRNSLKSKMTEYMIQIDDLLMQNEVNQNKPICLFKSQIELCAYNMTSSTKNFHYEIDWDPKLLQMAQSPACPFISDTMQIFSDHLKAFKPLAIINQNIPINSRYKFMFNGMYVRPESQYWFTRLPNKKRRHRIMHSRHFPWLSQNSHRPVPEQIGKVIAIDYKKKTVIVEWIKIPNYDPKITRGPGELNSKINKMNTFSYSIGLRRIVHLEIVGLKIDD